MNKLVIQTLLVLGTIGALLIGGLVSDGFRDITYENSGYQFVDVDKYTNTSKEDTYSN